MHTKFTTKFSTRTHHVIIIYSCGMHFTCHRIIALAASCVTGQQVHEGVWRVGCQRSNAIEPQVRVGGTTLSRLRPPRRPRRSCRSRSLHLYRAPRLRSALHRPRPHAAGRAAGVAGAVRGAAGPAAELPSGMKGAKLAQKSKANFYSPF